jgi:hypothetical protein
MWRMQATWASSPPRLGIEQLELALLRRDAFFKADQTEQDEQLINE